MYAVRKRKKMPRDLRLSVCLFHQESIKESAFCLILVEIEKLDRKLIEKNKIFSYWLNNLFVDFSNLILLNFFIKIVLIWDRYSRTSIDNPLGNLPMPDKEILISNNNLKNKNVYFIYKLT